MQHEINTHGKVNSKIQDKTCEQSVVLKSKTQPRRCHKVNVDSNHRCRHDHGKDLVYSIITSTEHLNHQCNFRGASQENNLCFSTDQ